MELIDDSENNDRAAFEEAFYSLSAKIRDMLRLPSISCRDAAVSPTPSSSSDDDVPLLDFPTFSGKYDEWYPFYDAFHSLIHVNPSFSDIHKLLYLRGATTHEANNMISSLSNYEIAWKFLKERYGNKRIIVENHIKAIMELPAMTEENASELRQIVNEAVRHVQALKALNRPTDSWDDILIYVLSSKLDYTTALKWQMSLVGDSFPTFKQFIEFVRRHCQVLEIVEQFSKDSTKNINSRLPVNKQKISCIAVKIKCNMCRGKHAIYQCKQFLALSVNQRIENVRSRKICLNCLRSTTHTSSKCPSGFCKICSRKHNTLLHIQSSSID